MNVFVLGTPRVYLESKFTLLLDRRDELEEWETNSDYIPLGMGKRGKRLLELLVS